MKANEMPDKVYIHKSPFWGLMANYEDITKNGIEYIRTDAFIEKAYAWLDENLIYYWEQLNVDDTAELLDNFKKAISV